MTKLKAALTWPFVHEPALMFAAVAAAVGLVNARWGLHLDATAVVTWIGTALGVGVLTRQTVVSPASAEKRALQAQNIGYLQAQHPAAPRRSGGPVPVPGNAELAGGEVVNLPRPPQA